jgi:hypothetical protein
LTKYKNFLKIFWFIWVVKSPPHPARR